MYTHEIYRLLIIHIMPNNNIIYKIKKNTLQTYKWEYIFYTFSFRGGIYFTSTTLIQVQLYYTYSVLIVLQAGMRSMRRTDFFFIEYHHHYHHHHHQQQHHHQHHHHYHHHLRHRHHRNGVDGLEESHVKSVVQGLEVAVSRHSPERKVHLWDNKI